MLHDIVLKGSTDRSVTVRIIDSGDGTPETGVVFNTSGIDLWYRREGAARTAITEATLAALTTAHTDGGFLHVSDGVYRLDLPDAAFATGANYVDFGGTVTGMVVIGGRVRLVDVNLEDTVRAGLTALPNAAAEAAGGLYTRGAGAGQINQANNGQIDANAARTGGTTNTGRDIGASVLLSSGTGTGQISLSSGAVLLQATQTGVTIPTVTTLTNAPPDSSGVTTLLTRVPSALFAGITSLAQWLGLIAGKQTGDSTARTELRATGAGSGTFDETTDSIEALRDRGDAAWTTATGFATSAELSSIDGKIDAVGGIVTTIQASTDNLPASPAAVSDIPTAGAIADAVHDEVVEGTTTLRQSVRLHNAVLGGKASGLATTSVQYRDLADTKDVVDATVDSDGNRSAVTRDLT